MHEQITPMSDPWYIANVGDNGVLGKLMKSLPQDVKTSLLSQATVRVVTTGDILVANGQSSTEVGYVIDGTLAMIQILDQKRKHIVGLLVPTDIFGRLFDGPANFQIEALATTTVLSFPRILFEETLRQNPEAERLFLVHLLDELDAAREWLLLMSGRKVVNRVASFLLIMVRRSRIGNKDGPIRLRVPLARKDLAHYIGARPESLSRAFRALEYDGVLKILDPYVFDITDLDSLTKASGDDLTIEHAKMPKPRK